MLWGSFFYEGSRRAGEGYEGMQSVERGREECVRRGENVRNAVGGEHEECNGRGGRRNIYRKVHSCPSPALPRSLCSGHWGMSLTNQWSIGYVRRR